MVQKFITGSVTLVGNVFILIFDGGVRGGWTINHYSVVKVYFIFWLGDFTLLFLSRIKTYYVYYYCILYWF